MKSTKLALWGLTLTWVVAVPFWAQSEAFDQDAVVLTYHKITGEPLDLRAVAERSESVRRASNFDRPDALKAETARLEAQLTASDSSREFVITVSDSISQYDHDRGEFSINLFMPGYYVPVQSFGQQYQLVFANAESVRAIPMPKDEARAFDGRLNQMGRQVSNEIHFRVVGKGDPAGGVVGARVVRAEMTSVRLLDRTGNAVFTPNVTPFQSAKAAGGTPFDLTQADVSGFRVGVKAKDLETTLARLFGTPQRSKPNRTDWFASKLAVNETGCMSMFGQDRSKVGAVCVTALLDADDIVRSIRVERVFPWFDSEVFRKSLVQKYGAVASAVNRGGAFALGWGPDLDPRLGYSQSAPHNALTAHYVTNTDFASRSGNALPQMRIVLNLVDAQWASGRKQ
ncbi:MAG: DUF4852 domain-containing protein [Acidobacteria bacterium]|nr:DUF4852 domain-containing protein [Acidobacteriota bacterium]MCI0719975.1 DUF4852 domain-containing protein [Acidobacteriota bacterium]